MDAHWLRRSSSVRTVAALSHAYADLTTGPTGRGVSVEERLAEVLERYGPDDPVHRAISRARVDLVTAVRRTEIR